MSKQFQVVFSNSFYYAFLNLELELISYRHPRSGYFCGIFPHQEFINLAFEFGVLLPDPQKVLVGDGKQVRYLRVKSEGDIQEPALKALLQAAIDLPERRDVKLGMIRSRAKPISKEG